jgi:hypothetical protein
MNQVPDPPIKIELMTRPLATRIPSNVAKSTDASKSLSEVVEDHTTAPKVSTECAMCGKAWLEKLFLQEFLVDTCASPLPYDTGEVVNARVGAG